MENEFAKIFNVKGHQILVTKDEKEDGTPQLFFTSRINGIKGSIWFRYDTIGDRDKHFETISSDSASIALERIEKLISK